MKNLNTIIKLTCIVMFSMMSTMAFSQANHDYIVATKKTNIVSAYDGSLQSVAAVIKTNRPATVDKHITKLKNDLQEVTGNTYSTNDLDVMLDVTQANYDAWLNAYNQLKMTRNDSNLFVIKSIIANIKSQL